MEEIHVTICDDEQRWRADIKQLCQQYAAVNDLTIITKEYDSGQVMLKNSIEKCDILFLDVEMKDMNGIDVKNRLQAERKDIRIVFITGHFETVQDAFGRNVYGFLTKPIDKPYFERKLTVMVDSILEDRKTIMLDNCGKCKLIYLKDIIYIAADGKYSRIYTLQDQEYLFSDKNIGFWREYLGNSGFVMSMRSILVNLAYVERIGQNDVLMKNGKSLEISRRIKKQFVNYYKDYIWKKGY